MSELTDLITLLYSYQQDDIDDMVAKLTERRRATWINTLTELAGKHGCNRPAGTPKGADAKYLKDISIEDAKSIANTYNEQLRNQVERLYKANNKGNRNYYYKQLSAWLKKRAAWKDYQIALQTDSTARQYATEMFYKNNPDIVPKFRYSPIPPVSKECIKRTAKGVVTLAYVQSHKTPAHPFCPHQWLPLRPQQAVCELLWVSA